MLIANKKEEVKKFNFHLLVAMIEMAEISDPSSEVEDMLLYNSFKQNATKETKVNTCKLYLLCRLYIYQFPAIQA